MNSKILMLHAEDDMVIPIYQADKVHLHNICFVLIWFELDFEYERTIEAFLIDVVYWFSRIINY